ADRGGGVGAAAGAPGGRVRAPPRTRGFDWDAPESWAETLRGADAAYLVHPADVGAPAATEAMGALAREAVSLGVRRLVLLSARGEREAVATEEAVRASGAVVTVVRAAWFAQNLSEGPLAEELRSSGGLVFPGGGVPEPFVDVRDIAEVAVAVLADEDGGRYGGEVVEVSGPRLLTFGEAVAEVARAAGRGLTYREVPAREYGERLAGFGVPEEEAAFLVGVFETLLDGRNARLSDGVRRVLGREPRDFAAFAAEAAGAGAWKA
ncbi:NmrA family transcriptional regulator, partial [Streptomyces sp. NPDC006997]|uniref:NmrA family NAD(P)-binding protein n=1 Tax=Streptomyces sp. NPDC006997 TaxID=3155356 RepID=UPI0033F76046